MYTINSIEICDRNEIKTSSTERMPDTLKSSFLAVLALLKSVKKMELSKNI